MINKRIRSEQIVRETADLIKRCNSKLPKDVLDEISRCKNGKNDEREEMLVDIILQNAKIADDKTNLDIFIYMLMYAYDIKLENEKIASSENHKSDNILELHFN